MTEVMNLSGFLENQTNEGKPALTVHRSASGQQMDTEILQTKQNLIWDKGDYLLRVMAASYSSVAGQIL